MLSHTSRSRGAVNTWPGFVDALASVLMIFIFMLLVFVVAQFFLSDLASNRFGAIEQLSSNVNALLDQLAVEKDRRREMRQRIDTLGTELDSVRSARDRLAAELETSTGRLAEERGLLRERRLEVASLQQDIAALRQVRDELEARVASLATRGEEREAALGALRDRSRALEARLADEQERTRLAQVTVEQREQRIRDLSGEVRAQASSLDEALRLGNDARAEVVLLNEQVAALRAQLATVSAALGEAEKSNERHETRIEDLGRRLNVALAERVEKLSRFRSDFFGRLREVLGERSDVQIVGDRFVFQSEVLFPSGSAELEPQGRARLDSLANTLKEVAAKIPEDVDWILRVDGHTDRRPISTAEFPSNWELSTARAISIVRHLIDTGIPPRRLAATGFAQFRPIDRGTTPEALARNRRIELKLTGP